MLTIAYLTLLLLLGLDSAGASTSFFPILGRLGLKYPVAIIM
jgi:hypothetical protein